MFAIGGAILGIIFLVVCFIIQKWLYKISFNYLFEIELSNLFEEINTKKITSNSIWIAYLLPIIMSTPILFILKFFKVESSSNLASALSLLPYIVSFFVLYYCHWKEFTLKNENEDIRIKACVVFYFAFLPYALMIVLMMLSPILLFLLLFVFA